MLTIAHIFENLRYAFTGKLKDRSREFRQLAKDVNLAAVLNPRDIGPSAMDAISRRYEILVEVMDAPAVRRPGLIRKFLDSWYAKAPRKSPAYGSHATESYAGYWSHEAAAVVILRDIDESTFRDHQILPMSWWRTTGVPVTEHGKRRTAGQ